ncbi:MAG TPA: chromosome segregation protein SMC [Burkholderiales bacterium]|nr:chromosome segregation protein SMC [Burkholderiales bacterium]
MRLTQIRLSGFKSFVDPTTIHFPGQLVGIVGPNGCGKSNVIDAVRWVLGETRASALRGDSMQDVIFNGSGDRKPMARASVELHFDNSLGRAGGQWGQYAEIAVKRVLQRDGDSSYHINGQHVRRRDVTDMFLGTGLGPRAYAIIEQGMISRVIEAKPEELRVFLEEAAGVSRYKERRRETENRLSDTRENLSRVNDIRLELGAQIEKLESQAEVATRYQQIQGELQLKQHLLWFVRRRDAAAERDRHAQEIERSSTALEAETATLREVESRVEASRAAHYTAGDAMNAAQAALYEANAEVARLESELRYAEETRQRLEYQHAERRAQLASWREQRAQLTQALHLWAGRSEGARRRVEEARARLAGEAGKLPVAEREFRTTQEQLSEARARLTAAEGRLQVERTHLDHVQRALEALAQRGARLSTERSGLARPDAEALDAQARRRAEGDTAIEEAESALSALQEECDGLEAARVATAERYSQASHELAAAQAQRATLEQIQAAAEDNAPLQEWLERNGLAALPRLWQRVRIDPGWEAAVESVLRERLHAIDLGDASRMAAVTADVPPVKASLFTYGAGRETAAPAGFERLSAKIHATEEALGGALSDWLAQAFVCEGVPSASELERLPTGAVLVNREGHQFTRHTVAFHAPDASDAGLLARQAEIDGLQLRVDELMHQVAEAKAGDERAAAAVQSRQLALEAARDRVAELQQTRHEAHIALLRLQQADERFRERSAQIDSELAAIAQDRERDEARRAQVREAGTAIEAEIAHARTRLDALQAAHTAAEAALAGQRQALQQAEREAQDAAFGERECGAKIAEIDGSVRLIDQQIERAEGELGKLTEELSVDPVPGVRAQLEGAVETRIGREKSLAQARDAVEAAAGALRTLEEERLGSEARLAPIRERIGELRLKEQAAQINRDQFDGQLREAGADDGRLAEEAQSAPRPSSLQGEITRLTQSLSELGAVNLAAPGELQSSRERKGFLDAQSADLEEAVQTLEDAIRRIDRETRELLRETFDVVNRHFASLFPVLFGGGEAKLLMTGEEILDAGVQVMAHPPGKRNSSIHLLSGGEKALTAIALVFAMFQLNPAPFCLLDEVDAPLDDSNTERFCDLVRRMSAQTQFLFISHNKITMEMAAQLIGVTMPVSGVSRVVAVDIEEALRIREELAA